MKFLKKSFDLTQELFVKDVMNLSENWSEIRTHFNKSFSSNFHVAVGSIDGDGFPTVTPIGSLFLNGNQTGFYFEKFPTRLPKYAGINQKICALAVNSGTRLWLRSLLRGKFNQYPGIKLYGELGQQRDATEIEVNRLKKRMRATRGLKGHTYLWGDMQKVREVHFVKAEMVNLGRMTEGLIQ
jgi:hypothetical protein